MTTQITTSAEQMTTHNSRRIQTPLDPIIKRIARRFGDKGKEVERFLKFAIVGTIGAIVDFATLNILLNTILPPLPEQRINVALATTIAFIAAVVSNFTWNRFWTYPDSRSRSVRRQLAQFAVVSVIGWLARTVWITLSFAAMGVFVVNLIQMTNPEFIPTELTTNAIGTNASQLIGVFVVMVWNFFINRYWTYNDVD